MRAREKSFQTKIFAYISLVIFMYYVVYYGYVGIMNPIPALGDSYDYHIPIAESILNGTFLTVPYAKLVHWYYPGASEIFTALFILLHIPLTLSNLFAVLILFFVCLKFALFFRLQYYMAILFAATICGLNVFVRWYNAVSIDVWLLIFFLLGIMLLEKPRKSVKYFLQLGFVLGMVLGSKYSGVFYTLLLLIVYGKNILSAINITRLIFFLVPFSIFGLFWYIRNFILKQNPMYPLPILGLPSVNTLPDKIWHEIVEQPITVLNALFGEYNLWLLAIIVVSGIYLYRRLKHRPIELYGINRLFLLSFMCLLLYITSPASPQHWTIVSSSRYTFTVFVPLILCCFLFAVYYRRELELGFLAIGNMIMVLSMAFYPKLTLIYIPLSVLVIYLLNRFEKRIKS